jgi:hypothetical protein
MKISQNPPTRSRDEARKGKSLCQAPGTAASAIAFVRDGSDLKISASGGSTPAWLGRWNRESRGLRSALGPSPGDSLSFAPGARVVPCGSLNGALTPKTSSAFYRDRGLITAAGAELHGNPQQQ